MGLSDYVYVIFLVVCVIAVIALIVALCELSSTLRKTRKTVTELKEELDPTLENVKNITDALQPAVAKIDPLIDRVQLTVDAANLEIMRLDTIMGNLGEISGSLTSAVEAVDTMANAPLNLVNKATSKINGVLNGGKAASDAAVALGEGKKAEAPQLKEAPKPVEEKIAQAAQVARTVKAGYTTIVSKAQAPAAVSNEASWEGAPDTTPEGVSGTSAPEATPESSDPIK